MTLETDNKNEADLNQWYAVRVMSRAEQRIAAVLEQKGKSVLLPLVRSGSPARSSKRAPLFPGYLFCQFDSRAPLPILTTPGVQYIVGSGTRPIPLQSHEIEALTRIVTAKANVEPWPEYCPGETVQILEGPLKGIRAIVAKISNESRVVVTVELLQRSVLLEVPLSSVGPSDIVTCPQSIESLRST